MNLILVKSLISSHVTYHFYQFVSTRYTTDFYIIKGFIWYKQGVVAPKRTWEPLIFVSKCAVPENIHTPPTEGICSWGVGGSVRPKTLIKRNVWSLPVIGISRGVGAGGLRENPFRGRGMYIFWNYTIQFPMMYILNWQSFRNGMTSRSKNAPKQGKVLNFWNWPLNLRSWKTCKGHGKSWNLKSSNEYEPCRECDSVWIVVKAAGIHKEKLG